MPYQYQQWTVALPELISDNSCISSRGMGKMQNNPHNQYHKKTQLRLPPSKNDKQVNIINGTDARHFSVSLMNAY